MRGGGQILPVGQEITCHFSQDNTMVTKFLDFIHKHLKYKVVIFYYFDRFSRNSAETEPRSFLGSKITKSNFFQLFHNKILFFISNLNDDCSQLSFEVYNICVAQKLQILEIFIELFFRLDLGHFGDLPRPQFQPQQPQKGIKF